MHAISAYRKASHTELTTGLRLRALLLRLLSRAFEDMHQQRERAHAARACAFRRCARSGFIFIIIIIIIIIIILPAVGWVAAARTRAPARSAAAPGRLC